MPEFLYGHWAVMESLRANRRKFDQLLLTDKVEEKGLVGEIIQLASERNVPIKRVTRRIIDDLAGGANHQNTLLRVSVYPYVDIEDVLATAAQKGEKPFLLLLDLLKDPQNVGSLIRVADAVGVHGVILQERRGVSIMPSVVNASSGAV
ncbi:MAG: 23S rRNA (guanosine(2251)-2'-O)-methyltransferase RlmB, partial [Anaerolineae bacterium]|nr:23S rRNA (guanosine(2251)-2'-O)-methyltransferase RlmB [Anaerolineae bacterium]